ncbi:C-C chemokine receptor type 7 [Anolis carolinensis]|uniref:C-C motif chemokine receptor 7 n=1 Tax=Anolis carolinensis TaxID=28377 RepID=A0A803SVQ2_ANOCA|nr:PREDICTED: C-C chemokine receptor type 7 [Anolis carolinensis]|eukprot:XP_008111583.1 PREDICTED: C-C chemokine receptor type 7 [Anolis carolinensis]
MDRDKHLKAAILWNLPLLFQFCTGDGVTTDYDIPDDNSTLDYSNFEELCKKEEIRRFRATFLPTIYSIVCFVGLAGNGLVMLTYIYFKRLKTMTDIYLLNLALADILFLLTLPFWAVSAAKYWVFKEFACKAVHCICQMSFFSGMLLLLSISIDRYFAIVQAPSAHRHRSQRVLASKVTCLSIWILGFILSLPEAINRGVYDYESPTPRCTIVTANLLAFSTSIRISQMVFGFFIPLLVMTFCYWIIIRTLLQARSFEKNRAIKVLIAVMVVFVLFQMPYNSVMLAETITAFNNTTGQCDAIKRIDVASDVTYSLACFRCCLNPFLYAFIGVKFRNDVLRLLKDLGCINQAQLWKWSTYRENNRCSIATETDTTTTYSP